MYGYGGGIETGLKVIQALRGHTSGLAVPHYVIDVSGGGGKIAVIPNPIIELTKEHILLKNYQEHIFEYKFPVPEQADQLTQNYTIEKITDPI